MEIFVVNMDTTLILLHKNVPKSKIKIVLNTMDKTNNAQNAL